MEIGKRDKCGEDRYEGREEGDGEIKTYATLYTTASSSPDGSKKN